MQVDADTLELEDAETPQGDSKVLRPLQEQVLEVGSD
jgi:hypothetical protein